MDAEKKALLAMLTEQDTDQQLTARLLAASNSNQNRDEEPLFGTSSLVSQADPIEFYRTIIQATSRVNDGDFIGLGDSFTNFIAGVSVRDSWTLNKTKGVAKILEGDIESIADDADFGLTPRHYHRRSDSSSCTRRGSFNAEDISQALLKFNIGEFSDYALNDSLTAFVSGGCIRDSGRLGKTKMCKRIDEDVPSKNSNTRSGFGHRTCRRRGYA